MERTVHLFHEARVQSWFLHWSPIVRAWDVYYGGLHFVVPIVAFVVLWRRDRARYLFFRRNVAAPNVEWWYHRDGCRQWFLALRDTRNNAVQETYRPSERAERD